MSQEYRGAPASEGVLTPAAQSVPVVEPVRTEDQPGCPKAARRAKTAAVAAQFIKFCVVGASSTVISTAVLYFVKDVVHIQALLNQWFAGSPEIVRYIDEKHLYIQVASTFGFLFGVANGFFWNSRWTFPQKDPARRRKQYARFFTVNIIGLILNWIVTYVLLSFLSRGADAQALSWQDDAAIFGAIVIVAFWNFTLNKFWTFRN